MALLQLPVRNDFPAYEFQISLDGRVFFLAFRFNSRANRWIMDILNDSRVNILMGIPLLTGLPLVQAYRREALPPGTFYCIDQTGAGRNPDRETLGVDVLLIYEEAGV
jgi:hypothetical protein